jgi:hypothetical protein
MSFGIDILTWGGLFAVYLCVDVVYTKYVLAVSKYQALSAANYSLIMYALTVWGTIEYVQNYWNAIPIGLGSWLGTYLTLRNENKKAKKEDGGVV